MKRSVTKNKIATQLAKSYDLIAKKYVERTASRQQIKFLNLFLKKLPKEGTIIDLGCGPGKDVAYFNKKGRQVVGIDLSSEMVKIAKKSHPKINFKVADMCKIKLTNEKYAGVWASSSIQHVERNKINHLIKEIYGTLSEGGIFYANFREGHSEGFEESEEYGVKINRFIAKYTKEDFVNRLEKIGFKIIFSETYNPKYSGEKRKLVPSKVRVMAMK